MRSCVADGRTDGQTDGAGYIGPAEGYGGSKKLSNIISELENQRSSNKKMYLETKNNLDAAPTWAQIFVLIAETTWIYLDIARVYHTMQ